jgi:transposase
LAATDGAQYRMLIQELGEWSEVLAWPHQIRWGTDSRESIP